MKIEIWSDFACPYCYIGERKLEKALEEFEGKKDVEIIFKSFQLNPNAVKQEVADLNERVAKKYGISYESGKAHNDRIINSAAELGLDYRYDILIQNNTSLAHQATKFARAEGKEKAFADRIFKAYFEEGYDVADISTLMSLADEVNLDSEKLKKALENEIYLSEVNQDQNKAKEIGVQGVPFFIINDTITISGAQSVEHFKNALNRAKTV